MKQYVMAFLKVGTYPVRTPWKYAQLQRAHLDNIQRLAREGQTGTRRRAIHG